MNSDEITVADKMRHIDTSLYIILVHQYVFTVTRINYADIIIIEKLLFLKYSKYIFIGLRNLRFFNH